MSEPLDLEAMKARLPSVDPGNYPHAGVIVSDMLEDAWALIAEVERLQAENAALRQALIEYGRHTRGCTGFWPGYPCQCGWREGAVRFGMDERLGQ